MESDQRRLQPAVKTCLKSKVLWRKHCQELSNGYATATATPAQSSTLQPFCNPATQQSFDSTPCFVLCLGFAMLALPANYKCNIAMAMPPRRPKRDCKVLIMPGTCNSLFCTGYPSFPSAPLPVCQAGSMAVDYLTLGCLLRCSGAPPLTWPLSCLTVHHKSLLSQS